MKVELLDNTSASYADFAKVANDVYKYNKYYRGTEKSIEELLLCSNSAFGRHSVIKKFVVRDGNELVARFALIDDFLLKDYIQVAFFEAQKDLNTIFSFIKNEIITHFPHATKIVVGLNGHLNYGAGILLNRFDEVPLFGLPYNPDYYDAYFNSLQKHKMFSYRFGMDVYSAWAHSYKVKRPLDGLTIRFMDKRKIKEESKRYTYLNNKAFANHPFWAHRYEQEDIELFYPFRHLLDNENLIIAEIDDKPIAFFLWYPDFNQLVSGARDLNALDLLKFKFFNKIDSFRFTEIGIIPEYQNTTIAFDLVFKSLDFILKNNYKYCEGGFIFESNRRSILLAERNIQRLYGNKPEPYRQYALYETTI